ncbi:MAG: hypothetical protein ABFC96_01450 [Thermoguttaceae bacterium]
MSDATNRPVRRRFPWRLLPVLVLCLDGGLALLLGVSGLIFVPAIVTGNVTIGAHTTLAKTLFWTLGHFAAAAHGYVAFYAARMMWTRRWTRSFAAMGVALAILAAALLVAIIAR